LVWHNGKETHTQINKTITHDEQISKDDQESKCQNNSHNKGKSGRHATYKEFKQQEWKLVLAPTSPKVGCHHNT